jgi:hypothetical protein
VGGRLDRPRAHYAGGRLSFGAPSYRGGAPNDLNVLAACPRTTISLALRLVAEAVVVTGVSVGVAAIAIIAAEAANEPSVAEAATEPSVGEAATEPSVSDAATEASIAEAAVEASIAEAAVEASTAEASAAAMETPAPSPSAASDSWGRRDRKDLAIDLKSDTCMIASPIREFEPEGPLER